MLKQTSLSQDKHLPTASKFAATSSAEAPDVLNQAFVMPSSEEQAQTLAAQASQLAAIYQSYGKGRGNRRGRGNNRGRGGGRGSASEGLKQTSIFSTKS